MHCVGGADLGKSWDLDVAVDYSSCSGGRNCSLTQGPLGIAQETSSRAALFPLWPLPQRQHHIAAKSVALPKWILKAPPPYNLSAVPRQRNKTQMKEQSKTSELSNEEITNLSDGEFKALVLKMFTELIELGRKMKKINEGYPKWNKAKYSGN